MSAHAAWPTRYQTREKASRRRRSKPDNQPASKGAPKQTDAAPMAINWPPTATGMSSDRVMSLSVPGASITPQPITKLPNMSAQRACDNRTAGSVGVPAAVPPPGFIGARSSVRRG